MVYQDPRYNGGGSGQPGTDATWPGTNPTPAPPQAPPTTPPWRTGGPTASPPPADPQYPVPAAYVPPPAQPTTVFPPGYQNQGYSDWSQGPSRQPAGRSTRRVRLIRLFLWLTTGKWVFKLAALFVALLMAWQIAGGLFEGSAFARFLHLRSPVSIVEGWVHGAAKTAAGTNSVDMLGPAILQQVIGVDKPALGQANFAFDFTRTASHDIGPWPCWYSQGYHAQASASAYVSLNPGSDWWASSTGHYVMRRIGHQVTVSLALPTPTLPTVHQVSVDNTLSGTFGKPDHSWTYPGFGCGGLLNPHFSNDEMGKLMQQIAFALATGQAVKIDGVKMVSGTPSGVISSQVIASAEAEAKKMFTDDFIGPTVRAYGDKLTSLNIIWVPSPK